MKRIPVTVSLLLITSLVVVIGLGSPHRVAFAAMDPGATAAGALAPVNPAASETVVAGNPIVEITKSCPSLRYVGRNAVFEITVTNRGDGPADNVVVTDVISGRIEFISADNDGVREGNNIVWRLGTLGAGASRTLKTTFRCNQIGTVRNTATVAYCVEASDECELEVKGIPAILLECVDDPDPIEINGSLTYTIAVLNQGSAVGTNIVVDCTLPPEEEHVKTAGPTKATVDGKRVTFAPLASLAPKARAIYKVTVKGVAEGDVRFRVELKSDQIKTPVMETESTHIY
jgi:uncharacterized repeat protein (TIGR01451 family)